MSIPLSSLLPIADPDEYKVHLACWNQENQPLDVFVRDKLEWNDWNRWRSSKDDFNRPYVMSLIHFYPETDIWLFGGIYKVLSRQPINHSPSYDVELLPDHGELVGRLKIALPRPARARSVKLENYYSQMSISELLKSEYTGERFPGYEDISHDFSILEVIFRADRPDWKTALQNVKGVYLITDKSNGKKYVGSAYGGAGIWARWASYMATGHGWSDELTQLITREGIEYARSNFRVSLLEYRSAKTDDTVIIQREGYWKEALQSRIPLGYNRN